jgi:hypothetical protein
VARYGQPWRAEPAWAADSAVASRANVRVPFDALGTARSTRPARRFRTEPKLAGQ